MKKRFLVILLVMFSVSVFAKEDYDTATLQFIEDIFNKKIPCNEESFYENGFVKDRLGDFVTTWEGLQVRASIIEHPFEKQKYILSRFEFISSDTQKFIEGWKKALSYAKSKKCKTEDCQISVANSLYPAKCYSFNHVGLVNNYPHEHIFFISSNHEFE